MRLPADNIPTVTAIDDNRYEIRQPDAAMAVRPVAPHAAATQAYFPKRKPRDEKDSQQSAGDNAAEEKRAAEDRRQASRRADAERVILDTRTGLDRRSKARRDGDIGNQIDEFA